MNEKNKEAKLMLHKIDGFDPTIELKEITIYDELGAEVGKRYYLPLSVKETWFWLMYKDGAIRCKTTQITETFIKAECRLYRHYKDSEDEYFVAAEKIVNINYSDPFYQGRGKEEIMGGYINAAKASAESIALTKAGFGIQIETPDEGELLSDKAYEESIKKIPVPSAAKMDEINTKKEKMNETMNRKKNELDEQLCRLGNMNHNNFQPYEPVKSDYNTNNVPITQMCTQPVGINPNCQDVAKQMDTFNEQQNMNDSQMNLFQQNPLDMKMPVKVPTVQPRQNMDNHMQQMNLNKYDVRQCETSPQMNLQQEIENAKQFVVTSRNSKFQGKTLGEIFMESPFAVPYIAYNSEGEQRQAAIILSKSNPETNAKLEQFFNR